MGPEAIFFVSLFGLSVTFFVFYFCFEPFRHYFQKRRHGFSYSLVKEEEDRQVQSATTSDEFESFVYDEYHTQDHEILVVSMSNRSQSVSICAFLQERKFEYFCQELPTCCQEEPSANLDNAKIKVSFTALSFWCQKWALAAKCVLLSDSKKFVSETWEKTGDIGKKIKHYQDQYFFNINAQWTLNYLCEEIAYESLWEAMINVSKQMLDNTNELDDYWIIDQLPESCQDWQLDKVHVSVEHFHQWPHTGDIIEQ